MLSLLKRNPPYSSFLKRAFSVIDNSSQSSLKIKTPSIEERVMNVMKLHDKVSKESLDISNSWSKMGLDSLDVVEVMIALEDEFNLEIPDHIADKVGNPFEISQYIQTRLDE